MEWTPASISASHGTPVGSILPEHRGELLELIQADSTLLSVNRAAALASAKVPCDAGTLSQATKT